VLPLTAEQAIGGSRRHRRGRLLAVHRPPSTSDRVLIFWGQSAERLTSTAAQSTLLIALSKVQTLDLDADIAPLFFA